MYANDESCNEGDALEINPNTPVIARFEVWLRSRGYEPERDPFMPAGAGFDESDDAADLVSEYLDERPSERANRGILMGHASVIGEVSPVWGDCGCGLVGVK
jgi:hypothetical protein